LELTYEICSEYFLFSFRTEEQLLRLAKAAGFVEKEVHVSRMPDNVILYLHICT